MNADCYTDLRSQEHNIATVRFVNGLINENSQSRVIGSCARAFRRGRWGFACCPYSDQEALATLVVKASRNAFSLSSISPGKLKDIPPSPGYVVRNTEPSPISPKEALDFLPYIDAKLIKGFERLSSRSISYSQSIEKVQLATSDKGERETHIERILLSFSFTLDGEQGRFVLHRKYWDRRKICSFIRSPELLIEELTDLYEELIQKSEGAPPIAGIHECILGSSLTGILAHEAIGHTVESDFVRAGSKAGDFLGKTIASPLITLVDFAFEYLGQPCPMPVFMDEEGIVARDAIIIDHGVLKTFLHNRESAALFGVDPAGNGRAVQFKQEPLIRMRNTAILPVNNELAEMIASIEKGYYLMDYSNGQADMTGEFMFSVNRGYEIVNGKLGKAIHDTTVSGIAFDMLKTVSAVSDRMEWTSSGCGKKYGITVGMGGPDLKCRLRIGG